MVQQEHIPVNQLSKRSIPVSEDGQNMLPCYMAEVKCLSYVTSVCSICLSKDEQPYQVTRTHPPSAPADAAPFDTHTRFLVADSDCTSLSLHPLTLDAFLSTLGRCCSQGETMEGTY